PGPWAGHSGPGRGADVTAPQQEEARGGSPPQAGQARGHAPEDGQACRPAPQGRRRPLDVLESAQGQAGCGDPRPAQEALSRLSEPGQTFLSCPPPSTGGSPAEPPVLVFPAAGPNSCRTAHDRS